MKFLEPTKVSGRCDLLVCVALLLSGLGVIVILVFLFSLSRDFSLALDGGASLGATGQVGDFIGGIVGSLWALAGVFLFYSALRLQRREFDLQRSELRLQREEITVTRVTNVIYRQLEVIEAEMFRLTADLSKFHGGRHKFAGDELIERIGSGVRFTDADNEKIRNMAGWQDVLRFNLKFVRSGSLCVGLIEQEVEAAGSGKTEFILDAATRRSLFQILNSNLAVPSLRGFFKRFEEEHQKINDEETQPGWGRFRLDKMTEAVELLDNIEKQGAMQ